MLTYVQLSLRLNEKEIVEQVFNTIPASEIQLIVQTIPVPYIARYDDKRKKYLQCV